MKMAQNSIYHQSNSQLQEEAEMIKRAKKDPKRFEPLYKKYHEQIFRFVYQRSPDVDTASDITSIIFMKAISSLDSFTFRGVPFSSWLYRIAISETNKYYRQKKKERTVFVTPEFLQSDMDEIDAGEDVHKLEKLKHALNELDADSLELIEMRFFEQRSVKEVAEILDISESNAKVRCFRALKKLKALYPKNNSYE